MRLPSNKTLVKGAIYGAIACISGVMYVRSKIIARIRNEDFFRETFKIIRANQGAIQVLGEPIKECGFDLSDSKKNFYNDKEARFEVNVKGPKERGTIYFWADRIESGWDVRRIELELKNDKDRRLLIKN